MHFSITLNISKYDNRIKLKNINRNYFKCLLILLKITNIKKLIKKNNQKSDF